MPPEFSVIIPTRGDSPHLRVALDSALGNRADLEVVGDGYLFEAMARLPLDLRNYIYFLAGAVPTPLRRRWFGRGGRPASAGHGDGAPSGPRGERSATVNGP